MAHLIMVGLWNGIVMHYSCQCSINYLHYQQLLYSFITFVIMDFTMKNEDQTIPDRLSSYGQFLCGSSHGWKAAFAEKLGITRQHMGALLSGRVRLGGIMQDRLRALGANVDFIMTGKETQNEQCLHIQFKGNPTQDLLTRAEWFATWVLDHTEDDSAVLQDLAQRFHTNFASDARRPPLKYEISFDHNSIAAPKNESAATGKKRQKLLKEGDHVVSESTIKDQSLFMKSGDNFYELHLTINQPAESTMQSIIDYAIRKSNNEKMGTSKYVRSTTRP